MSSGLVIQKSSIDSSWEGKRLWLNLSSLGFNSLHVGGALRKNEEEIIRTATTIETANENVKANTNTKRPGGLDNDGSRFKSSRDMHQEYLKQVQCKSRWAEHVRLQSDMIHERMGVEVRPIPGTAGKILLRFEMSEYYLNIISLAV